ESSQAPTRGPRPFGANLFAGTYAAQRENGLNPDYRILPGDRVMVNAWGAVQINDVFAVDTQGNVFLPTVGPIHLAGVRNADLTDTVRAAIRRVYRGDFGVYTNLLTASPVAVFVTGGVPRPGRYAGIPNDSVLFFLDQAGGIDPDAGSYRTVRVIRQGQAVAEMDLYEFLLEGTIATPQFEDGDTILVGRRGPTVEVHRPDATDVLVELDPDAPMTGRQVLAVVSGGARTTAVTLRGMRDGTATARTLTPAALAHTPLHDGDILTFREDVQPDFIVVHLEGEFRGPSALAVRRGARLLDLLNFVPVDPELSRTGAVYIRRDRIAREQRQALQDSLDRLERTTMLALSDTNNEAQIRVREAELVRAFVERARDVEPLGLMVTSSAGRQLNVLLQDGDTVVIPPATNVVHVVGEVRIPHAVMYRPDLNVHEYVAMAGGYSLRANRDRVIIRRANAEIEVGDWNTPIHPGDQVMIPPSVDDKFVQNGIDLAQVVYQIAVAASVVLRPL
ncbi:MAG TPA: SLBB domain-containing protein, partial [Sandaracinaceae bacterium LLY-WYZ-13_1]|nr:SLBB domain-containing protein [Sandaracinaceae bacterium LLY-WYZ-13_1]